MTEQMKTILTDWNWSSPVTAEDMRARLMLLLPLALVSFFFAPILVLLLPLSIMSSHRRYLDLFGTEFYCGQRLVAVWVAVLFLGLIPVVGPLLHIWVSGWWDRRYLRRLLGTAFEYSELI